MIPVWLDPTQAMADPGTMAALVCIGAFIGVVGGLFGIGGGFLLTPILMEIMGLPERFAIGSSSCHAVGIAATGLRRHLRFGNVKFRLGFTIAIAAALGALCGSILLSQLNRMWSDPSQQIYFKVTIRVVLLVVLGIVAFLTIKPVKADKCPHILQRIQIGPQWPVLGEKDKTFSIPGVMILAMICGIAAGFLGIGGGVVYMPLLIIAVGIKSGYAVRVSLIIVLCSAVSSTIAHSWAGNVSLAIAMLMMLGSSIGVQLGAYLCQKIHGDRFKKYFALIILSTMAMVIWKLIKQFA